MVATGRISVRLIADAIGCTIGSDRFKEVKLRPISLNSNRSQVVTETKDSAIGRRVIFSRGQAESIHGEIGKKYITSKCSGTHQNGPK